MLSSMKIMNERSRGAGAAVAPRGLSGEECLSQRLLLAWDFGKCCEKPESFPIGQFRFVQAMESDDSELCLVCAQDGGT